MADSVASLSLVKPEDLKITQVLDWSGRNRPRAQLNKGIPWWLTQHQTGNRNDWATARSHMIFVTEQGGGPDSVSFHLVVDDIEAYQLLTLSEAGYHASDGMDDWENDTGGWGSIAMELCVNYDNGDDPARYLKAKQNAVALWAAVINGDPRLEYGQGGPDRFSADRLAPHNRWAWDRKWCPRQLLDEENMLPWSGDGPFKDAVRFATGVVPMPDTLYPPGMDAGIAEMLFGPQFNPKGPISKKWLERGKATNQWPKYIGPTMYDDRTYYRFDDGWVLWRVGNGPITELG